MLLEKQEFGGAQVITVSEARIDAAIAIQFKERVRELASNGPDRVVLNLSAVEFLDSSGLGALVAAMKQLAPDRRLELACPTETVRKVLRLTRMDTVFTIHEELDAAADGIKHAS